jgi:hypothetical protein
MALILPDDIPIAAAGPALLKELGEVREIAGVSARNAFAFKENGDAFRSVWCRLEYRSYRRAWHKAAAANLADPLSDWGSEVDVDHLIARRVARVNGFGSWFIRLHPVYREINRSAGAGREKHGSETRMPWSRKSDVVFAGELQLLKAIGHPVGNHDEPVALFDE